MPAGGLAWLLVAGMVPALLGMAATVARAQPASDAAAAAVSLLDQATTVQPRGGHNELLRALRHLRDPQLRPLFQALSARDHAALIIHGELGLAELRDPPRLPASRIARVGEAAVQAELIGAALDSDLIQPKAMRTMLGWPGLSRGVKVLLAVRLVGAGAFDQPQMLRKALEAEKPARRALAALLLHQLGEADRWPEQAGLARLKAPIRRRVSGLLLQTAMAHQLDRIAPWALGLARRDRADHGLRRLALKVAMRFSHPEAAALWQRRFNEAAGPVQRMRLALVALRGAPWLKPETFAPLQHSDSALFQQMGRAGRAIAGDAADLLDPVARLVQQQHPAISRWALDYARQEASLSNSQPILLAIILATADADHLGRGRRIATIARASATLAERSPETAPRLLGSLLQEHAASPAVVQGILLGLVRCQKPVAGAVLRRVKRFEGLDAQNLAVLLKARSGMDLTEGDRADLRALVRGGGRFRPTLRVQAAWLYLKRTEQLKRALQQALQP